MKIYIFYDKICLINIVEVTTMEFPIELKRLIEKYKAHYHIIGSDDEILKKIIPSLEDEDIIRLYNELCKEEDNHSLKKWSRPNFEKYREDLLSYLDNSMVKSEIIRREQYQSSKPDLTQRNYTYISEFTTTLDNKLDKQKIIRSFYRKIYELENERNFLNVKQTINNIELSIHIYRCILHIREKMDIDLVLYRGFNSKKKYKLQNYIDFKKMKNKRKKNEQFQKHLQHLYSNQIIQQINELQKQLQELKIKEEKECNFDLDYSL